jgi:hypothetical protein
LAGLDTENLISELEEMGGSRKDRGSKQGAEERGIYTQILRRIDF